MKLLVVVVAVISMLFPSLPHSQSWMPVIRDIHGDSIPYHYPPHDSIYVHNNLVVKFKPGVLNNEVLCYECSSPYIISPWEKSLSSLSYELTYPCRQELYAQQFAVGTAAYSIRSPLPALSNHSAVPTSGVSPVLIRVLIHCPSPV